MIQPFMCTLMGSNLSQSNKQCCNAQHHWVMLLSAQKKQTRHCMCCVEIAVVVLVATVGAVVVALAGILVVVLGFNFVVLVVLDVVVLVVHVVVVHVVLVVVSEVDGLVIVGGSPNRSDHLGPLMAGILTRAQLQWIQVLPKVRAPTWCAMGVANVVTTNVIAQNLQRANNRNKVVAVSHFQVILSSLSRLICLVQVLVVLVVVAMLVEMLICKV